MSDTQKVIKYVALLYFSFLLWIAYVVNQFTGGWLFTLLKAAALNFLE